MIEPSEEVFNVEKNEDKRKKPPEGRLFAWIYETLLLFRNRRLRSFAGSFFSGALRTTSDSRTRLLAGQNSLNLFLDPRITVFTGFGCAFFQMGQIPSGFFQPFFVHLLHPVRRLIELGPELIDQSLFFSRIGFISGRFAQLHHFLTTGPCLLHLLGACLIPHPLTCRLTTLHRLFLPLRSRSFRKRGNLGRLFIRAFPEQFSVPRNLGLIRRSHAGSESTDH
jgi:hypothetical protein